MCKDNKKCKACAAAQIGKTMAKKTRKSSKSLIMDGLYTTAGVVAGGYAVPKLVEMVDPNGKLDPRHTQGVAAAGGFFGAMNTKGEIQKVMLGVGIGAAANLLSEVICGRELPQGAAAPLSRAYKMCHAPAQAQIWIPVIY